MERPFPAYKGDDPYVFVCYSHEDAGLVYPEIEWLRDQGIHVWYDEGISAGAVWRAEIAYALDNADTVLCYVSTSSLSSDHCNREINYALDQGKKILPVHLEDIELTPDLKIGLSRVQALQRGSTPESIYGTKLLAALSMSSEAPPADLPPVSVEPQHRRMAIPITLGLLSAIAAAFFWMAPGFDSQHPQRSVTVLPPEVVEDNSISTAFANSVTSGIANRLNRYSDIELVAQSNDQSATAPEYVVSTSVQVTGEQVSIDVHLVRRADNLGVWSEIFHAPVVAEGLSVQTTLASTMARYLRRHIARDVDCRIAAGRTDSAEAADFICRTWREMGKFSQEGSADWQLVRLNASKALELDPEFAAAHQMMSIYYNNQADTQIQPGSREQGLTREVATERARYHAARALTLDPVDPFSHEAQAQVALQLDLDYEVAAAGFEKALSMDPANPWASFWYQQIARSHIYRGEQDSALTYMRRALSIDDSDTYAHRALADLLMNIGDWPRAIEALDAGLEIMPEGFDRTTSQLMKIVALQRNGDTELAERVLDDAWEESSHFASFAFPIGLATVGRIDEARQITGSLVGSNMNGGVMTINYLSIGDLDNAFTELHRAIDERNQLIVPSIRMPQNWVLEPMQTDPRWSDILAHLERVEAESRQAARAFAARSQQ